MQLVFITLDIIFDTTFIIIMNSNTSYQVKYRLIDKMQVCLIYINQMTIIFNIIFIL